MKKHQNGVADLQTKAVIDRRIVMNVARALTLAIVFAARVAAD
jgi:hypothetical protein